MTDVEIVEPRTELVVQATEPPEASLWKHFASVATTLSATDFVPAPYRNNKPAIMACLAYGHELGLGPMQSLQSIDVIQGKPTLKPEMMRSLIRAAGHSLTRVEATDDHVTMHGVRRDGDSETVTYTIADAQRLGLTSKSNWKNQPRAMLTARATAEIARSLFSDVIMGASYTAEELEPDEPSGPIPMDEPRTHSATFTAFPRIVTDGNRGAGRVVVDKSPVEEAEVVSHEWGWHTFVGTHGDVKVCNRCLHPVYDHTRPDGGCVSCACSHVLVDGYMVDTQDRGVASPRPAGEAEPADEPGLSVPSSVNAEDVTTSEGSALPPEFPPSVPPHVGGRGSGASPGGRSAPTDPAPSGAAPTPKKDLSLEAAQRRKIFALCGKKELNIGDDARHALIDYVTEGRVASMSDTTADENAKVLTILDEIAAGRVRLVESPDGWVLTDNV